MKQIKCSNRTFIMHIRAFMQTSCKVSSSLEINRAFQKVKAAGSPINSALKIVKAAGTLQSTLNRQSKWISLAIFAIVLLWRHDAEAMWAAMGMVLNFIISLKLKSLLNHKRPDGSKRSDPGMPSSHAQTFFFIALFIIFSVLERLEINGWTLALLGLNMASASYLSWLRVATKQHTMNQVFVGAAIGSFFSIFWSHMWNAIVIHAFISYWWIRIIIALETAGLCIWFIITIV